MIREKTLLCKLLKVKTSSKSLYGVFYSRYCMGLDACPHCNAGGSLNVHCYYDRKIIDFIGGHPSVSHITVMRVKCPGCGYTHAILPDFIVPYSSYSLFFILRVIAEYLSRLCTVGSLCERFSITVGQLYRWVHLWYAHKREWLGVISDSETTSMSFIKSISTMGDYSVFSTGFYTKSGMSFMQSHANPPQTAHCTQRSFCLTDIFSATT